MIVFDCIRRWRAHWPTRGNTQSPGAVIAEPDDDLTGATQTYELDDAGMSTAEYAVGTIAACALATAF
jgi:hypothetical protein